MSKNDSEPLSGMEQVHLQRVNWAFQRQLTAATLSLTSALGAFGVLSYLKNWIIVIPIFIILVFCILVGLWGILKFEKELLDHQAELQDLRKSWNLNKNKSTFGWFFTINGNSHKLRLSRLIFLELWPAIIFSLMFIDIKILQPNSLTFTVTSTDSISFGFLQFFIGLLSGLVLFLFQDIIRRKLDANANRKKMIKSMILELNENKNILTESTYAPIARDVWDEWKRNGFFLEFSEELMEHFMKISAMINNRNNLLTFYQIGIQKGELLGIKNEEGNIIEPLTQTLANLRIKIEKEIDLILPLIEKEV
jgi:hypothetical protein